MQISLSESEAKILKFLNRFGRGATSEYIAHELKMEKQDVLASLKQLVGLEFVKGIRAFAGNYISAEITATGRNFIRQE